MVKLNDRMIYLLKQSIESNRPDLMWVLDHEEAFNSEETVNELLEAVGSELIKKGLDKNDLPNNLGYELEELIDVLGRMIY